MAKKNGKATREPNRLDDPTGDVEAAAAAEAAERAAVDGEGEFDGAVDEPAPSTPDRQHVDKQPERTRYLKCILTPAEVDEMRREREAGDVRYESIEGELIAAQQRVKDHETSLEAISLRGRELSRIVRAGWEMRDVACEELQGIDTREDAMSVGQLGIITIRLDTGEVVDWRDFEAGERQGKLFGSESAPA